MDAPLADASDERRNLGDTVGSTESGYGAVEAKETVVPLRQRLPERERDIVRMRYVDDLRQSEIAERIGISQMHVSRLLRRALEAMHADAVGAD